MGKPDLPFTCHSSGLACSCTTSPSKGGGCGAKDNPLNYVGHLFEVGKKQVPYDPDAAPAEPQYAGETGRPLSLPDDDAVRGDYPMFDGLVAYFPNALAEVSKVSKIGNDQHNPGQPMHWRRNTSMDHENKIMRHLVDAGTRDGRGVRHTARLAWRALAMLQEELERDEGLPPSRASTDRPF